MDRRDFLKASVAFLGTGAAIAGLPLATRLPFIGTSNALAGDGGVLYGALAQPTSGQSRLDSILNLESKIERRLDVVHHRFPWSGNLVNPFTKWLADSGRTPTISWSTRLRGGPKGPAISWAEIAAGVHDARLQQEAADVMAAGWPAYIAWHKEPEKEAAGNNVEYKAAYDHVHDVFDAVGVTNLTWLVTLTAATYRGLNGGPEAWLPSRYDVLGVDGYNRYTAAGARWKSFETIMTPARNFAVAQGRWLFVNETGSVEGDPGQKAQWFDDMGAVLKTWPEVIGFSYDHELTSGNYYVDTSASSLQSFKAIGQDPYFQSA
jgi:hypothetical protein